MNSFDEYLGEMVNVCKRHFYPGERYHGEKGHLMFARESLGGVLSDYDDEQIRKEIGKCYGAYIRCLFGTSNEILLDNKRLVKEIWFAIERYRKNRAEIAEYLAQAQREREAQNDCRNEE